MSTSFLLFDIIYQEGYADTRGVVVDLLDQAVVVVEEGAVVAIRAVLGT